MTENEIKCLTKEVLNYVTVKTVYCPTGTRLELSVNKIMAALKAMQELTRGKRILIAGHIAIFRFRPFTLYKSLLVLKSYLVSGTSHVCLSGTETRL